MNLVDTNLIVVSNSCFYSNSYSTNNAKIRGYSLYVICLRDYIPKIVCASESSSLVLILVLFSPYIGNRHISLILLSDITITGMPASITIVNIALTCIEFSIVRESLWRERIKIITYPF